jgi:hypothetical protein
MRQQAGKINAVIGGERCRHGGDDARKGGLTHQRSLHSVVVRRLFRLFELKNNNFRLRYSFLGWRTLIQ